MTKTNYQHLGLEQRYRIGAYLKAGNTKAFIAKELGVARSTISRELARNSTHSATPPDRYKPKKRSGFCRP